MKNIGYIMYTNCQKRFINNHLQFSSEFNSKYKHIKVPLNFKAIGKKLIIPSNILDKCQLFIYQPTSENKYGDQSSEAIIKRLPKNCRCISFPYIYFNGYWPQLNKSLHPQFTHGDDNIVNYFKKNAPLKTIIKELNDVDFYDRQFLIDRVDSSLKILESREQNTDIKLSSFIRDNYQHYHLFHIEKHPSNLIAFEVAKQILSLLDISNTGLQVSPKILVGHQTPIYPSVAHHLGLTFFNPNFKYKVNFCSQKFKFNKYIKKYFNRLKKGHWNL